MTKSLDDIIKDAGLNCVSIYGYAGYPSLNPDHVIRCANGLYATAKKTDGIWRITIRGSVTDMDWVHNFEFTTIKVAGVGHVSYGMNIDIAEFMTKVYAVIGSDPYVIEGHSRGAGEAKVGWLYAKRDGKKPIALVAFAPPRIGYVEIATHFQNDPSCVAFRNTVSGNVDEVTKVPWDIDGIEPFVDDIPWRDVSEGAAPGNTLPSGPIWDLRPHFMGDYAIAVGAIAPPSPIVINSKPASESKGMTQIIDTNQVTTPQVVHLQADGIKTVIRYLSAINPAGAKCVKAPEAKALAAAGIRLALVNEGWGDFAHGGISAGAGERDGKFCAGYAGSVGASAGAAIFYAVDVDATATQINKLVLPYFAAIKEEMEASGFRTGVYGSGAVCAAVIKAGLADLAWLSCSTGWTGSRQYLAAKPKELVLVQHVPTMLAHMDCDPDDAFGDFGDFLPFDVPEATFLAAEKEPAALPLAKAA
jgi:Domain of unknown function (DUF1906)/Lipase (class 3)